MTASDIKTSRHFNICQKVKASIDGDFKLVDPSLLKDLTIFECHKIFTEAIREFNNNMLPYNEKFKEQILNDKCIQRTSGSSKRPLDRFSSW
jgi:hypothetical protein